MSLQAVVSYLACKKETIQGKKAFQKFMYFIDAKGVPTQLSFRIYHFGPYSSDLDYQTDNLELEGSISLGKTGEKFVIQPGDRFDEILTREVEFINQYSPVIDSVIELLPDEPKVLELWSTTHFVANSMYKMYQKFDKGLVIDEVRKIKQDKFTMEQIDAAYDRLFELGFLP
ncbi:MAG: hypothetical protein P0Y55_00305 [Candidatus Cohnella colombiensis]|uniref:Antitoxin SocA-like Panacea domain-containing protein n=1 Tax=Candidatus Cohnella colombiensis TaxID=3121368 RepID=A0AA95F0A4_9BACL|nr:MAG: hypothetical protein P0Y55_00305 [Cohnella sp.]